MRNIFDRFFRAVKYAFVVVRVMREVHEYLSEEKYEEALRLIEQIKEVAYKKDYDVHFSLGFIYFNQDKFDSAKDEIELGIRLLEEEKRIRQNDKRYLLAWAYYAKSRCFKRLKNNEETERWQDKSEEYFFNMKEVLAIIQNRYPMPWHVDYCDYHGLPRPRGTEGYQRPSDSH